MKVYVMPADTYGCGHYRLIWPADVLRKNGFDISIIPPAKNSGFLAKTATLENGQEVLTSLQVPADAEVIVIQRPAHYLQPQMVKGLRQHGIAVVVDMDDDMSTIHPDNRAYFLYRPRTGGPMSWKWAAESCREATLVTTSTRSLQATYAAPGRGVVLDNYVPAAYLNFPKVDTGTFGWAGTIASHPNDPQLVGSSVQKLIDEGYPFKVIGDGQKLRSALRLKQDPEATGTVSLMDWAKTIADTIDVGLVPLAATSFNTSKSRLKGIEMSAVGVPWVASPREEYRRLSRESGGGFLAETPKEWYAKLKQLLVDPICRKEVAEAGKAYMVEQTYEANAWRWMEAWTRALEIQRS